MFFKRFDINLYFLLKYLFVAYFENDSCSFATQPTYFEQQMFLNQTTNFHVRLIMLLSDMKQHLFNTNLLRHFTALNS